MYLKAVAMIVFLAAVAAGMLSLRQQRWEVRHEITQMHQRIEQTRRATWENQVKVAAELHPDKLEHKLAIAQIELEPITATSDPTLRRIRVIENRPAVADTKGKARPAPSAASRDKGGRTKR